MRSLWETMLMRWLGGTHPQPAGEPGGLPWADQPVAAAVFAVPKRETVGRGDAPVAEPAAAERVPAETGARDVAIADEEASFGVG